MAAISSMGKTTPVSLLAHMTETRAVSGRMDLSSRCKSSEPSASTGRKVHFATLLFEEGAMVDEWRNAPRRWSGCGACPGWVASALCRAALLLSVPQLVKTTSLGVGIDKGGDFGAGLFDLPPGTGCRICKCWKDCRNGRAGRAAWRPGLRGPRGWWRCYQNNKFSAGS